MCVTALAVGVPYEPLRPWIYRHRCCMGYTASVELSVLMNAAYRAESLLLQEPGVQRV